MLVSKMLGASNFLKTLPHPLWFSLWKHPPRAVHKKNSKIYKTYSKGKLKAMLVSKILGTCNFLKMLPHPVWFLLWKHPSGVAKQIFFSKMYTVNEKIKTIPFNQIWEPTTFRKCSPSSLIFTFKASTGGCSQKNWFATWFRKKNGNLQVSEMMLSILFHFYFESIHWGFTKKLFLEIHIT